MLLTKTTKLRVNQNNYKYLLSKGFNNIKINDIIDINVNDLSKNSGHVINVKCDICGKEKMLQYRRYLKSYNNGGYYSCSNKCNKEKRNYEHTDEIKEKVKNTCLEKYNVDSYSKTIEYKEKIKKTCLNKYNVENVFQLKEVKNKIKKTCLKKYGVDNPSKSNDIKKKKEKTCLINNNVKSPYQNIEIFNKSRKNGLKIKKYKNSELYYQGTYELDFLNKYYNILKIKNGLSIKYIFNNEKKIYHSDFYLPEYNLIIEIKSTYWYNKCKKLNIIKEEYTQKHHNYLIILDKNYDVFDNIINHQSP